jgi:mannose-6-phosphate isomerase-like protein (cupin superfamily)
MGFFVKLSWEDLYSEPFSPIKNSDLIKKETGLGVSSRDEFREKYGFEYLKICCLELWNNPQINYDGRVLGCPVNFWDDYGNAFKDGLEQCLNNQKINYAREMLMGKRETREGIPCAQCKVYKKMIQSKNWITSKEIEEQNAKIRRTKSKALNIIEGKILRFKLKNLFFGILKVPTRLMRLAKRILKGVDIRIKRIFSMMTGIEGISANQLTSWIYHLQIPLEPDVEEGWKPYFLFRGFTSEMKSLACHAAVLIQGHMPHRPHLHKEEEILLLLDGEVEIIISDGLTPHETKRRRLKRGEFVYYPSNFAHTLQTMSEVPASYMMYKWYAHSKENKAALKFGHYNVFESLSKTEGKKGFCTRLLFEGPTVFLKKLHCHITSLSPQTGYEPHVDDYDVSIIVLEGEVETLGKRVGPHSVIYYAAGKPHGMYNPGEVTAKYIVFEFHGHPSILVRIIKRLASMVVRLSKKI